MKEIGGATISEPLVDAESWLPRAAAKALGEGKTATKVQTMDTTAGNRM
jgi:hypothetical protein